MYERQCKRIDDLKEEEKKLAVEYEELQRRAFLCEEFTRRKAEMLTEKINSNFKLAKFKLFEMQKNGGIQETCEVTYNGVPFADLNSAAKVNIGLDVIQTLCKAYDVSAPIFQDNMESVTAVYNIIGSQQIRLIVDKDYQKLTVLNRFRRRCIAMNYKYIRKDMTLEELVDNELIEGMILSFI